MVIRVGKRIIEIVIMIASKFPNASFGLILGLLVGVLVSAIPLIGGLLGAFVLPIAAAIGLATGYMNDIQDQSLVSKFAEAPAMLMKIAVTVQEQQGARRAKMTWPVRLSKNFWT